MIKDLLKRSIQMNEEWSQLNKMMQVQIGKKETFAMGI